MAVCGQQTSMKVYLVLLSITIDKNISFERMNPFQNGTKRQVRKFSNWCFTRILIGCHIRSFDSLFFSRVIHATRQCTQYFEYCYTWLYTVVSRWSTLYKTQVYIFRTLVKAVKWHSLYKLKYRNGWKSCSIENFGKNYLIEGHLSSAHIKLESVRSSCV